MLAGMIGYFGVEAIFDVRPFACRWFTDLPADFAEQWSRSCGG